MILSKEKKNDKTLLLWQEQTGCRIFLKHDMYSRGIIEIIGMVLYPYSILFTHHTTHLFSHEIQISRLCHCYIIVDQIPSEIFLIAFYRVCGNNCVYVCLQSTNNYLGDCRTPLCWKSDKGIPTPYVHTYLVPLYNTLDIYNTGVIIPDPPSDEVGRQVGFMYDYLHSYSNVLLSG